MSIGRRRLDVRRCMIWSCQLECQRYRTTVMMRASSLRTLILPHWSLGGTPAQVARLYFAATVVPSSSSPPSLPLLLQNNISWPSRRDRKDIGPYRRPFACRKSQCHRCHYPSSVVAVLFSRARLDRRRGRKEAALWSRILFRWLKPLWHLDEDAESVP